MIKYNEEKARKADECSTIASRRMNAHCSDTRYQLHAMPVAGHIIQSGPEAGLKLASEDGE